MPKTLYICVSDYAIAPLLIVEQPVISIYFPTVESLYIYEDVQWAPAQSRAPSVINNLEVFTAA